MAINWIKEGVYGDAGMPEIDPMECPFFGTRRITIDTAPAIEHLGEIRSGWIRYWTTFDIPGSTAEVDVSLDGGETFMINVGQGDRFRRIGEMFLGNDIDLLVRQMLRGHLFELFPELRTQIDEFRLYLSNRPWTFWGDKDKLDKKWSDLNTKPLSWD